MNHDFQSAQCSRGWEYSGPGRMVDAGYFPIVFCFASVVYSVLSSSVSFLEYPSASFPPLFTVGHFCRVTVAEFVLDELTRDNESIRSTR